MSSEAVRFSETDTALGPSGSIGNSRITSYNVCYTKLLRTYKAAQFAGETVKEMTIASRMTMSNMAIEMGGKAGLIDPDRKTVEYVKNAMEKNNTARPFDIIVGDKSAEYEEKFEIEVNDLEPVMACPHNVDNVKAVREIAGTPVDQRNNFV